jgi:branched-subunit amino acid aminotransferase/4-amino-4-deoxychorismate lyase
MTDPLFLDSRWVPLEKARLSPLNTALFFGESLLEAIPVYRCKPLFITDHLDRLEKGCRFLDWPLVPREKFKNAIRLYPAPPYPQKDFIIRFSLVQEIEPPANPRHFSKKPPKLLAMARPLRSNPHDFWPLRGRVGISRWVVPGKKAFPSQFKWIFYMMIRQDFRRHPEWDEMLRLDEQGFVVDGGTSAPLWFSKGVVFAPPLDFGGLESVTRKKILALCRSLGVKVVEKKWRPQDVLKQGELFFAGSGVGIMAATHLDGRPLNRSFPLTLRLWRHYREWALQRASF